MCGIIGFWGANSEFELEKSLRLLSHRGPDDKGIFHDQGVSLGHARLAIQDLSPLGHQPMSDDDQNVTMVFNGEIYNFKELREELRKIGYNFRGGADSEVLLKLYLEYGTELLNKLNGIYAFAIWDSRKKLLFLARDGVGVKPLYYSETSKGFVFSSELKALLHNTYSVKDLNPQAIARHLTYLWSPSPETMLLGVYKLEPGHALIIKNQKIDKKWQFYDLPNGRLTPWQGDEQSAIQAVSLSVQTAVERQMVSDVPVGAFLSGGLDSSAVVAFAKECTQERLQCFTIDLQGNGSLIEGQTDDLPYAHRVAKYLDVDLNVISVGSDMVNHLEKMIWHLDEPQADLASLNTLFISQLAKENGIKVLLSGAGGDDIFTGYRRHYALQQEKYWEWLPYLVRKGMSRFSRQLPVQYPLSKRIAKAFSYAELNYPERLFSCFFWQNPNKVLDLLHPDFKEDINFQSIISPLAHGIKNLPDNMSNLERMLYLESKFFLTDHNLNYTDKMTMAMGVEARVPLLDPDLMNLAARLPEHYKQRGHVGKWIFKKAMEPYLPNDVIYRSKTGFGTPLRHWLKHELKDFVDDMLCPSALSKRGIFDAIEVQKMIQCDRKGQIDASYTILGLICIELWCQLFLDSPSKIYC